MTRPLVPPGRYICPRGCGAHIETGVNTEPPDHLCPIDAKGHVVMSRNRRVVTLVLEGMFRVEPVVRVRGRAVAAK